ncbi:DUF2553 family protein [Evansella cellulosilytica]|uniref:DUF2553 family protein n=1 Tax=Evansella cellulosilytica TaxID=1413 RepID=UPI000307B466|nr:DUF2553 family protein [Evansella cellulosilytica]
MKNIDQDFFTVHDNKQDTEMASEVRVDVTDKVEHKKESNGETALYLNKEKIGEIKNNGQEHLYEMAEGFDLDEEKIYKKEKKPQQPQSYVEGCDMGWC